MKIKHVTALAATFLTLILLALAFDVFEILRIQREVVNSEENRFASYKLADALRQSSDDLTRMARTFVATGDPRYEKSYFDILDIRNGRQPRPANYSSTFWWRKDSRLSGGEAIPLQTLMRQAGFKDQEFALLAEAQSRSDKLVDLEKEAFAAMGNTDPHRDGASVHKSANPDYARMLLFGARYADAKAAIMEPIETFLQSVDARTGRALEDLQRRERDLLQLALLFAVFAGLGMLMAWLYLNRGIHRPIDTLQIHLAALTSGSSKKLQAVREIAAGNLDLELTSVRTPQIELDGVARNEMGALLVSVTRIDEVQSELDTAFRKMAASLRRNRDMERARDWLKTGLNELNGAMHGELDTRDTADKVLTYLAERLQAGVGALYLYDTEAEQFALAASYATDGLHFAAATFSLDHGVIGQAGREQKTIVLSDVPEGYLQISSGCGRAAPKSIVAVPLTYADGLVGVVELGAFRPFNELEMTFLEHMKEAVAVGLGVNQSRQRLKFLLTQTEQQAEELRVQQEELQQSNEELQERADALERLRERH